LESSYDRLLTERIGDHAPAVQRRRGQLCFPGRITILSPEQRQVEILVRSLQENATPVLLIEFCNNRKSIVCISGVVTFLYIVDGFSLSAKFAASAITSLGCTGARVDVEIRESRGWRKTTRVAIEFASEDTADRMCLILETLMISSQQS
jgi:hypothetical protein